VESDKGVKYSMLGIKFAEAENGKRTETTVLLPHNYWPCLYVCSVMTSISACGRRCWARCTRSSSGQTSSNEQFTKVYCIAQPASKDEADDYQTLNNAEPAYANVEST